jgi:hypothetical protein
MRKEKTLLVIGLWIIILPFLGFTNSFRKILFVLTGFAILYISYLFYLETKIRIVNQKGHSKTFVDNILSSE